MSDDVKLSLVTTGVIGLRLTWHRADEVGVDMHGKVHHIDGFDNVRRPIATLLVCLDFVDDHIMLLYAIRYALNFEDIVQKGVGNLDVVFDGSRLSELRFLSDADELLDIEPLFFEKSCIVRYWIIRIVGHSNTADNSEFLDFLSSVLKVGEWRLRIE